MPSADPATLAGIDVALVSHAHHDHLDVPSLRSLEGDPIALCPPPAVGAVGRAGLAVTPMEAGDTWRRGAAEVVATDADHDGRRWPTSQGREAVGFVVSSAAGSVYFAGDTGEFAGMSEIGPVDVALLPVAGWGSKLGPGHLDADGAACAAAALGARIAVPIHWGTYAPFRSSPEGAGEGPARRFEARAAELAPACEVRVLQPGESTVIPGD